MNEQRFLLNKQSTSDELKRYFAAILELSKTDNEFPINLDDVWPLVYKEKGKAVRELKKNFIEGEDFTSFAQNVKREVGGTQTIVYHLSISCLEYLIVRKKRQVFEVYRKVFHQTAKAIEQPKSTALPDFSNPADAARAWADQYEQRLAIEKKNLKLESDNKALSEEKQRLEFDNEAKSHQIALQTEEIKHSAPKVEYYDDVLMSSDTLTTEQVAKQIGMDAAKLNKKLRDCGLIYKASDQWVLHAPYDRWQLHATRTYTFTNATGKRVVKPYTVFNQRGVRMIWALKNNDWNIKRAVRAIKGESAQ